MPIGDGDGIKTKIDNIENYSKKIDDAATNGLEGVHNSNAYRTAEIERHFHGQEKWFGDALVPSGEIHVADRVTIANNPISLLSGNNIFGQWVQILGSGDTPVKSGSEFFDAHRYLVTTTDSTNVFVVQIVGGESSEIAAKILAEDYTEILYIAPTNNNDSGIELVMSSRIPVSTKAWARTRCIGADAKTINFYFGIHEYEG